MKKNKNPIKKEESKNLKDDKVKTQTKFLKNFVENLINAPSSVIVDLLIGKKDVNEFLIAKKLELTINQTRNILYKLSDYGLVSFIRKKDKRKGWYIYFWTLNIHQSLNLLKQNLEKKLENLEFQLKSRNEKRYYLCNTCSIELTEEVALLNDFACPECEEIYELVDSNDIIKQLEKEVTKIKKEIELLSVELEKEQEKIDKKKAKEQELKKPVKKEKKKSVKKEKKKSVKKEKKKVKIIKKKKKQVKNKIVKKHIKNVSKLLKKLKPKKKK